MQLFLKESNSVLALRNVVLDLTLGLALHVEHLLEFRFDFLEVNLAFSESPLDFNEFFVLQLNAFFLLLGKHITLLLLLDLESFLEFSHSKFQLLNENVLFTDLLAQLLNDSLLGRCFHKTSFLRQVDVFVELIRFAVVSPHSV